MTQPNSTARMEHVIARLLNDLPTSRDWLDPALEAEMKDIVANRQGPGAPGDDPETVSLVFDGDDQCHLRGSSEYYPTLFSGCPFDVPPFQLSKSINFPRFVWWSWHPNYPYWSQSCWQAGTMERAREIANEPGACKLAYYHNILVDMATGAVVSERLPGRPEVWHEIASQYRSGKQVAPPGEFHAPPVLRAAVALLVALCCVLTGCAAPERAQRLAFPEPLHERNDDIRTGSVPVVQLTISREVRP